MGRKRKQSRGRAEGGQNSAMMTGQKRRAVEAQSTSPTETEEIPQNSDADAPEVNEIIKVELESDPEQDNNQQAFFEDPGNLDLASYPDIDIGEVTLMRTPKTELILEEDDVNKEDSNKLNEPETPSIDMEANIGGYGHASTFTSKPSEGLVTPKECENYPAATSNVSSDLSRNTLQIGMAGKHAGTMTDDTEKEDKNYCTLPMKIRGEKDGEIIARLTAELAEARKETETVKRELRIKTSDVERETGQSRLLVEQLQVELEKKNDLLKNATLSNGRKDVVINEKENELVRFKATYFKDRQGNFQLHLPVKMGDEQMVKELIQMGADVNAGKVKFETMKTPLTPLLLASTNKVDGWNTLKIIKHLIEHGADVLAARGQRQTFLHKLASESSLNPVQFKDMAVYLISKNLTSLFDIRDKYHRTPLMLAAENGKLEPDTLSLLHQNGVDLKVSDDSRRSVLFYAIERCIRHQYDASGTMTRKKTIDVADYRLVKHIVSLGVEVNVKSPKSMTPLLFAAWYRGRVGAAINIIKFLIDSGADVDAKLTCGYTFLHLLVRRVINPAQFTDMVTFLISKDLSLSRLFNAHDNYPENTPFQNAVKEVEIDTATLSLLNDHGVNFNAVDTLGESVLFHATTGNRTLKLISDLVELGANPKHLTNRNESMLHPAATNCNVELLKFFLDKGLDINAQISIKGDTPLHFAIRSDKKENINVFKTVQFLLRNGANSDIRNRDGQTPRDVFIMSVKMFANADEISTCFSLGSSC